MAVPEATEGTTGVYAMTTFLGSTVVVYYTAFTILFNMLYFGIA